MEKKWFCPVHRDVNSEYIDTVIRQLQQRAKTTYKSKDVEGVGNKWITLYMYNDTMMCGYVHVYMIHIYMNLVSLCTSVLFMDQ